MTKIIYFDTFSGISGDMTLGALVDAGMPLSYVQNELSKLNLGNFHLEQKAVEQNGINGVKVEVVVEQPEIENHRHFHDIKELIENSSLVDIVKNRSLKIFELLAQAEGKIHDVTAEEVHTNTIEGFWTGVRNFLRPFRSISKKYLQEYVAVYRWGHNYQHLTIIHLLRCMLVAFITVQS